MTRLKKTNRLTSLTPFFDRLEAFEQAPHLIPCKSVESLGFSDFCTHFLPHLFDCPSSSPFHQLVRHQLPERLLETQGHQIAIAAPRGESKSTLIAHALLLWSLLCGHKQFAVIVMVNRDLANLRLEALKHELQTNTKIQAFFPEASLNGGKCTSERIQTVGGLSIFCTSIDSGLRGIQVRAKRPDLLILDDIELDSHQFNSLARDKLSAWLYQSALCIGSPMGDMDTFLIGTVLHHDSLLARTLENPMWKSWRFASLIQAPKRLELWQKWFHMTHHTPEQALDFRQKNKASMDEGAEVSWPEARGLESLMRQKLADPISFQSEQQNAPIRPDGLNLPAFEYHHLDPLVSSGFRIAACDPSLGKASPTNDPAALVIAECSGGRFDLLLANQYRIAPDALIVEMIRLSLLYSIDLWLIESVAFQAFFHDSFLKAATQAGLQAKTQAFLPKLPKHIRILGLAPLIQMGHIRLQPDLLDLIRQAADFPHARHDDLLDALSMIVAHAPKPSDETRFEPYQSLQKRFRFY